MHLRMTGNLLLREPGTDLVADLMESDRLGGPRLYESHPDARHLRARIVLDDGGELWFTDARRFGHGVVLAADEIDDYFAARLGIEPLDGELTGEALCRLAAERRAPLKSFLLNQTRISGIGNIYADEALWRARLHPLSPAGSMKLEHCEDLAQGIIEALEAGLELGGSSIDDYRDARGERGRDAGRVPGPHARGRGLPALRRGHPQDRRDRPVDLLLPRLPACGCGPGRGGAQVRA